MGSVSLLDHKDNAKPFSKGLSSGLLRRGQTQVSTPPPTRQCGQSHTRQTHTRRLQGVPVPPVAKVLRASGSTAASVSPDCNRTSIQIFARSVWSRPSAQPRWHRRPSQCARLARQQDRTAGLFRTEQSDLRQDGKQPAGMDQTNPRTLWVAQALPAQG